MLFSWTARRTEEGGSIRISTSRIDATFSRRIPGQFSGKIAVNLKELIKVVQSLASSSKNSLAPASVDLRIDDDNKLVISKGKKKFRLEMAVSMDDMPEVRNDPGGEGYVLSMSSDEIKMMADFIPYACDDFSRQHIHGIHVEAANGTVIRMTASNGHVMLRHYFHVDDMTKEEIAMGTFTVFQVPFLYMKAVVCLLDGLDTTWYIKKDGIGIFLGDEYVWFRQAEDVSFPNWEDVIPKHKTSFTVRMPDLEEAIKVMSVIKGFRSNTVKLAVDPETKTVHVSLENTSGSVAEHEIECETNLGTKIATGIDINYLENALKSFPWLKGCPVTIRVEETENVLSGIMIDDPLCNGDQRICVIMPVRL